MTKNKLRLVLIFLAPMMMVYITSFFWVVAVNQTDSLPYKLILIRKAALPERGQYVVFKAPDNGRYNNPFIKLVGGAGGDTVSREGRSYYVAGRHIGDAKEFSKLGEPTNLGPVGVIPEGSYFVYTNNKDSYDSRYQEIGWVESSNIIGIAYPIY
jgi:conjugal transfer pilin signal peptidase TrbI